MSHKTHEGIRNLSHVSSISLALLFFYFITRYQHESSNNHKVKKLKPRELGPQTILQNHKTRKVYFILPFNYLSLIYLL